MSYQLYNRRGIVLVLVLVFTAIICFAFFGIFLLEVQFLFIAIVPFCVLVLVASIIIRYSRNEQRVCPRCRAEITEYMDACRNCGFQLIKKCPACGMFLRSNVISCNNCGHKFEIPKDYQGENDYIIVQKDIVQTHRLDACPYCDTKIDVQNLRYCESCGTRLF